MQSINRVFVEKRPPYRDAARALQRELQVQLGITALREVRIVLRYDAQGVPADAWALACAQVFAEAAVDELYPHKLDTAGAYALAVEYLPGQYDQRAEGAAQCIQILTHRLPRVRCATVYLFYGALSAEDIARIRRYLINPVDSREAAWELPRTLDEQAAAPPDVPVLNGLCTHTSQELAELHAELALAMSEEDLAFVQAYFRDEEGRDPSLAELRVIDTYWSDHCRHTTFLTRLEAVTAHDNADTAPLRAAYERYQQLRAEVYAGRDKPVTLMDVATIGAKALKKRGLLGALDESDEINACSIKADVPLTDGRVIPYLIQFKNETHNHPTEIEPFGGAATCLGGAIRDPLAGRAYVYHAMRVTGSGDPRQPLGDTLPGKLPQRSITLGAAHGFSSYGNQIGLATGQVSEYYHPGYIAKRLELGAVVGAVPVHNVRRMTPQPGDVVILLGGRTGRDGCGGATGSSKTHTQQSLLTSGAEVQKGNPPTERKLQRLFRNPEAARLIKRCNDFGAGGVCVAIGELADALDIDLDAVPLKYDGLDGTEIAISESQERMAVVVDAADAARFAALADEENLEATQVARITDTGRMRMRWRGRILIDLKRSFLNTNGAPQYARAALYTRTPAQFFTAPQAPADPGEALLTRIAALDQCSLRGLAERFDASIGAGSVLMPFGGRYQLTPAQAMAALVPVQGGQTTACTVMAHGFFPELSQASPFHGAAWAVVESLCRLAAAGADTRGAYLSFQEYFPRMDDRPERWGMPLSALLGALWAQESFGAASIGGKDSMSGSFGELDVPPTLVSFAIAMSDARHTISAELKRTDSQLVLLNPRLDEHCLPDPAHLRATFAALHAAIRAGQALAVHTVGTGGVGSAVARMCLGNGIGATLSIDGAQALMSRPGAFVVELAAGCDAQQVFPQLGARVIGRTQAEPTLSLPDGSLSLTQIHTAFTGTLEDVFTATAARQDDAPQIPLYTKRSTARPRVRVARPRVVIPVFPGTNCEYDTQRAFEAAGAQVRTLVLRTLDADAVAQSIAALAEAIANSQIICLPGGFSAGDEPDGSGKFIAAVFNAPAVREATQTLLGARDGLMLGICNGFQALIKLGLVPYGQIRPMQADSPTLTFNAIGRHQSRIVHTRITSVASPWLAHLTPGQIISVPISHGEGRFVCTAEQFQALAAGGQIAAQYADHAGKATYRSEYNPSGSLYAVEALLSPDGRVLGKMGHSERVGPHIYKNVPGEYHSGLFTAGVHYFQ